MIPEHKKLWEEMGTKFLDDFGLVEKGWRFSINKRKRAVGLCNYTEKTIYLSEHFLESDPAILRNTILHEIAHALVGPGHHHDNIWRNKAREIGCTGDRCENNAIQAAPHNYEIDCENCGPAKYKRFKNKLKSYHRCGSCSGKLTVRKVR